MALQRSCRDIARHTTPAGLLQARWQSGGILGSILHGSEAARAEGEVIEKSHSRMVARGKYIHRIMSHKVYPGKTKEYRELIGEYYSAVQKKTDLNVKLTGSWEIIVGELDTFVHITEFDNGYKGYDKYLPVLHNTKEFQHLQDKVFPLVQSRHSIIAQEFAFWPTAPAQDRGGIYEMRTYRIKPGALLEWENEWRRGLEARKHHHEPIAAFFSQLGELHQVNHIWHYPDLATRKESRDKAWSITGWAETVARTVKLTNEMKTSIMVPLPFSPLR